MGDLSDLTQHGSALAVVTDESGPDVRATVRTEHDVHGFVTRTCFKTGPPRRVGLESEWFVEPRSPQGAAVSPTIEGLQHLLRQSGPLPGGSLVTFEPGGQLELSTACGDHLPHAIDLLTRDLAHVDTALHAQGLHRVGVGAHPTRSPRRLLRTPRYTAMEQYLDVHGGPAGRAMMCTTAALQVCLQAGSDPGERRRRWRQVHALSPVLVAVFASSPLLRGRPTGWASSRQLVWHRLDRSRCGPVHHPRAARADRAAGPDLSEPVDEWARYALDARVMLLRTTDGPWRVDPGFTLREWVTAAPSAAGAPAPTYADLAYHLTTLFPPVRPHAWLELRMIDALPDGLWPVAAAVASALVDDPRAADAARDAVEPLTRRADRHTAAARDGLGDRDVHPAAVRCFRAAAEALPRLGADPHLVAAVDTYTDRYVDARRTPSDDVLAAWRAGDPVPALSLDHPAVREREHR